MLNSCFANTHILGDTTVVKADSFTPRISGVFPFYLKLLKMVQRSWTGALKKKKSPKIPG